MKSAGAPKVFVAMPFSKDYDDVFENIRIAVDQAGMRPIRVDKEEFAGSIISHICSSIDTSDFVVAVVSEENGNVYYEIGLAHCQRKPVVLLTSDPKSLKFDLRDHRAIVYNPSDPRDVQAVLTKALSNLRNEPPDVRSTLASRLGGPVSPAIGYERALEKIKATLAVEMDLQEPIQITAQERLTSGEIAIEAVDFFQVKVRAVVDINGVIRKTRAASSTGFA